MRAERRTLLVLLGLIALAGAALALLTAANRRAEEAEREAEEGSIPLTAFGEAELEAIEYTWQGQTVRLAYDGEDWTLADDPDYHLDQTPCDTMAAALVGLRANGRRPGRPAGQTPAGSAARGGLWLCRAPRHRRGDGGGPDRDLRLWGHKPRHRGHLPSESGGGGGLHRRRRPGGLL